MAKRHQQIALTTVLSAFAHGLCRVYCKSLIIYKKLKFKLYIGVTGAP